MACIFRVENYLIIFHVKNDETIFELKMRVKWHSWGYSVNQCEGKKSVFVKYGGKIQKIYCEHTEKPL